MHKLSFFLVSFIILTKAYVAPAVQDLSFSQKSTLVTERELKQWVELAKKKLRKVVGTNKKQQLILVIKKTNVALSNLNNQLKKMRARPTVIRSKTMSKQSDFLLSFQLATFQELFPLLELKRVSLRAGCVYLRQKIVQDVYPTYENIKQIKLSYAHKELNKMVKIICQK